MRRGSLLAATVLLWPLAIVNAGALDARVQLALDRANADLVEFLGRAAGSQPRHREHGPGSTNTSSNSPLHLSQIKQRPDVVVEHVASAGAARGLSSNDLFVATPEMANKPEPTVRVAFDEPACDTTTPC